MILRRDILKSCILFPLFPQSIWKCSIKKDQLIKSWEKCILYDKEYEYCLNVTSNIPSMILYKVDKNVACGVVVINLILHPYNLPGLIVDYQWEAIYHNKVTPKNIYKWIQYIDENQKYIVTQQMIPTLENRVLPKIVVNPGNIEFYGLQPIFCLKSVCHQGIISTKRGELCDIKSSVSN